MQLHLDSYGARLRVKDGLLEVRYAKDGVVQVQRFSALQVDTIFLRKGTSVSEGNMLMRQIFTAPLVQRFRRFLHGQLQFVKFVRGEGDADYLHLHDLLKPRGY